MNTMFATLALAAVSCGGSGNDTPAPPSPSPGENGGVSEVTTIKSNLSVDLSTDKACYKPGETVKFTASEMPSGATVRYRHGSSVIKEEPMSSANWSWTPENSDFKGYLVEIYQPGAKDKEEIILGTIAVDVSSDWTKFPRYGFVATFDRPSLTMA